MKQFVAEKKGKIAAYSSISSFCQWGEGFTCLVFIHHRGRFDLALCLADFHSISPDCIARP